MEKSKNETVSLNREYKDSIFTSLFKESEYALKLFECLHPEVKEVKAEDIKTATLSTVITNQRYNDLTLQYQNKIMVFVEEQSSFSKSLPFRMMLYAVKTLDNYLHQHSELNIYMLDESDLPIIEFYCICSYGNNSKNHEETLYFGKNTGSLHAEVKMIYITDDNKSVINQYLKFVDDLQNIRNDQSLSNEVKLQKARSLIDQYIESDMLANYLRKRKTEVNEMLEYLTDQEEVLRRYVNSEKKLSYEKGTIEGKIEGTIESILSIAKNNNFSVNEAINLIGAKDKLEYMIEYLQTHVEFKDELIKMYPDWVFEFDEANR